MDKEEIYRMKNDVRKEEFTARTNELNALQKRFGEEVSDIVLAAKAKQVEESWRQIARDHGDNSVMGLINTLWKWVEDIGMEYTYTIEGNTLQMNVTKCPIADMAIEIGEPEWGFKCYCCDDESIVRGFNNEIVFERTKTLMEGHDCCNHKYTVNQPIVR